VPYVDAISVHEAGHALVAHSLGVRVIEVSVRSTLAQDGYHEHDECSPESELRILVAGEAAELRADSEGLLVPPKRSRRSRQKAKRKEWVARVAATSRDEPTYERDSERVERLLAEIEPDPALRRELYVAAVTDAYVTVANRWGDLLRLARALVARETLSGRDVVELLDGGNAMERNGQGDLPDTLGHYVPALAGEVVRNWNESGKWLAHEREAWMRAAGVLDDEGGDDGNEDED
jgi:hypothetical protein